MTQPQRDYVATSQGRVAYRRAGAGPGLVLIHGALVTADDMVAALMASFAGSYDVVAFDRPGHGGSDQARDDQGSPWCHAAVIAEAWETLGMVRPIVVGHSFGGAVALSLAMTGAAAGVVALAPICFPEIRLEHVVLAPHAVPGIGPPYARTAGAGTDVAILPLLRNAMFLPQLMPDPYAAGFPFAWASRPSSMVANALDSYALFRALTLSTMRYPSCRTPVTILGGTRDLVVGNGRHGLIAARIMPAAEFQWVEGMGHMVHHFRQDLVVEAVVRLEPSR